MIKTREFSFVFNFYKITQFEKKQKAVSSVSPLLRLIRSIRTIKNNESSLPELASDLTAHHQSSDTQNVPT